MHGAEVAEFFTPEVKNHCILSPIIDVWRGQRDGMGLPE
jgi:hypothetical protein